MLRAARGAPEAGEHRLLLAGAAQVLGVLLRGPDEHHLRLGSCGAVARDVPPRGGEAAICLRFFVPYSGPVRVSPPFHLSLALLCGIIYAARCRDGTGDGGLRTSALCLLPHGFFLVLEMFLPFGAFACGVSVRAGKLDLRLFS